MFIPFFYIVNIVLSFFPIEFNLLCSIVVYPVIPKGHIIYRLIPSAAHTDEDIEITLKAFSATKEKLDAGAYKVSQIPDMADAR